MFQDTFGADPRKCFLAVYDGHHGRWAAEMAATEFHHAMLMEMEKFDSNTQVTTTHEQVCLTKQASYYNGRYHVEYVLAVYEDL